MRHARHDADFYATPTECTRALLAEFPVFARGVVWEPACGDGAIARVLAAAGADVYATDLHNRGYGRGGIDFRTATAPAGLSAVVTNPPFGRLAEDFIRGARELGVPFAMLLKATYWHAKSRVGLFYDTGPVAVMPMTWRPVMAASRGKSPTMDFQWTVWEASPSSVCTYLPVEKP